MAATDASRILRVPGTLNFKYYPPRQVKIAVLEPSREYDLSDFDIWLPEEDKQNPKSRISVMNVPGWEHELLPGVSKGKRNTAATKLAGRYLEKGLSPAETLDLLTSWNYRNQPPLSDQEITNVVNSINRTHHRNHPVDSPCLAFPSHVITGAAGEFSAVYSSYMETPREFLFMSYLVCLGSHLAKKLRIESEIRFHPRFYVLLLGQSADDRKSTAINKCLSFFMDGFENFEVCFGVGSAEGLQKWLETSTTGLLLCFDEFKQFVSKCRIEASVLLPCVNTLFESTRYENRTKKSQISIFNAHLSILAASTVQTYEACWSSTFTDIGFNNRLFLVPGTGTRRFSIPEKVPQKDIFHLRRLTGEILALVGKFLELPISPSARNRFDQWYMDLQPSIHAKRLDTYALRFMSIFAINDLKTVVDEETVKKVIHLCDWQLEVRKIHDPVDADNTVARMEQKIRRALTGPKTDRELKQRTNANRTGLWFFEAAKKNLMKSREITWDKRKKRWSLK